MVARPALSDHARAELSEMIDDYDRGLEDERRFRERSTAADRTSSTARSHVSYVRTAARADTSQRPSD
jgi:hypothetical protein